MFLTRLTKDTKGYFPNKWGIFGYPF